MVKVKCSAGDMCDDCGELFDGPVATSFVVIVKDGEVVKTLCSRCFIKVVEHSCGLAQDELRENLGLG